MRSLFVFACLGGRFVAQTQWPNMTFTKENRTSLGCNNFASQADAAPHDAEQKLSKISRVVIVGGGFAGMEVAKALQGCPARVLLIDRHNHTLFQPLLYQVATAALSPADIAVPIRGLLQSANTETLLDEVIGVDAARSHVTTLSGREFDFTILVLATGSLYNYFGHDDWERIAPSPKTLDDAVAIRNRLLLAFEKAEMCSDDEERQALMTFVIVGAGATGVEMAGAIAELAHATLARDFHRIKSASARIILIEAGSRVLSSFPERLGKYAHRALTKLGVEIILNAKIDHIDETGVVASRRRIDAATVIWGAGVKATPVSEWLGVRPGPHGTVSVNADFSVETHRNIFVIGDIAEMRGKGGKPLPGLAAVAKQEGTYVGKLIKRRLEGNYSVTPFRYRDYGTMATIGRSIAVADLRGFWLTGTFAWILWGLVHIYFLIGFRNRVAVFTNWLWAWFSYARSSRIIIGEKSTASDS